jgi:predicted nucleic acid-binding protein
VAVVVDASLVYALIDKTMATRRDAAEAIVTAGLAAGETLHAPELLPYELASALTRAVTLGGLDIGAAVGLWDAAMALPLQLHVLRAGSPVLDVAARMLRRHSAYDAAYVALALQLGAELWTCDRPLARNISDALSVRVVE